VTDGSDLIYLEKSRCLRETRNRLLRLLRLWIFGVIERENTLQNSPRTRIEIRGGLPMSCDNRPRSTDDILVIARKEYRAGRSVSPRKLLSNPFLHAPLPTSNASLMRPRSFSRGRWEVEGIRNCSPSRQQDVRRIVRCSVTSPISGSALRIFRRTRYPDEPTCFRILNARREGSTRRDGRNRNIRGAQTGCEKLFIGNRSDRYANKSAKIEIPPSRREFGVSARLQFPSSDHRQQE